MKPLAGHCDQCPVAPDAQIIAKLDCPVQKRPRFGLGDELEDLGNIGGTERDRLRIVDPRDALLDHLHKVERLNRLPAVWQFGFAVPAGHIGSWGDEVGSVLPVLCRWR